jgi:dephospho-CoA kinase
MILIGLTGGVGMGKSTAAHCLATLGLPVVDTDVLARRLVEPGQPALAKIRKAFGEDILDSQGVLRRDRLAELVFGDEDRRQVLEAILHPPIREAWQAEASIWRARGEAVGVVVIPLLFESGAEASVDVTVCVACSRPSQAARLALRGWTSRQIEQRVQAQWPVERKMAEADFVVWAEGGAEIAAAQLCRILDSLGWSQSGGSFPAAMPTKGGSRSA